MCQKPLTFLTTLIITLSFRVKSKKIRQNLSSKIRIVSYKPFTEEASLLSKNPLGSLDRRQTLNLKK